MIPICSHCRSPNVRLHQRRGQMLLLCLTCGKTTDLSDSDGGIAPVM